ncbi:MAG: FAD-dependent oxidoreductase, partial [Gammaproteobacteria bacterium]
DDWKARILSRQRGYPSGTRLRNAPENTYMARWECIVCGWVYDETRGSPDEGVAPGTVWGEVPADFLCPDCGVGKEDFELIDNTPLQTTPHHEEAEVPPVKAPVIIIGTGLAGYNLAREFRKLDTETPLVLITSDDGRMYSKPMLSTGFTKNTTADDLATADAGTMATQLKASVWTHTRVTAIDTARKEIRIGDSTTVAYAKLVLAWGAEVIRPPLEGDGLSLVYSVNDLMDYADFRTTIANTGAKKVLIVGAGLIGSEFANDLSNGGFDIDVVDPLGWSLPTLLPERAGRAVQAALEAKGVRFHFGRLVRAVNRAVDGKGIVATLDDGSTLAADIGVSAIGVRPRLELARAAGIAVNRGIVADRQLRTSAPDVYTLGDCAEVGGWVLYYVAPLMACARVLAKTLAGEPTDVAYPPMPVTIKTPACPVVVAPPAPGAQGSWQVSGEAPDLVAEFRGSDGKLLGFALTGEGTRQKMALQKDLPALLP